MSVIWVVRNRHGDMVQIHHGEPYEQPDGWTTTRETILTPEMAAVIAAAKAWAGVVYPPKSENYRESMTALDNLVVAVAALRAVEGDV
jgi:hypothetical protein